MDPDERLHELLHGALARAPEDRTRFLDEECEEPALRAEALSLLAAYEDGGELFAHLLEDDPKRRAGSSAEMESPGTSERRFAHYVLVKRLGRGGQGEVYLAHDTKLRRDVALKVLSLPLVVLSPVVVERFRREGEAASRLDHPAICTVYETGEFEGVPYIAMRYVEGESLAEHIRMARESSSSGPVAPLLLPPSLSSPPAAALGRNSRRRGLTSLLAFFEQAARALHVAHEQGFIHRDIKPGNIMVSGEGDPVILDFGLVRSIEADAPTLTGSSDLMGTPHYMSPEQIAVDRTPIDRATDTYSLGATLYESVTLQRPFEAATREGLYHQILSADLPSMRILNGRVTKDLATVVETALERDVERRYRTALDFAEDLRRVRECEPIRARAAGPFLRLRRWTQRNPALATLLLGTIVVLLAAVLTLLAWLEDRGRALRRSDALALVGASASAMERDPRLAVRLAREAVALDEVPETISQLQAALAEHYELAALPHDKRLAARGAAFSPDGTLVVTASHDRTARLWDLEGNQKRVYRHESAVLAAVFSPDGSNVLTATRDGTVTVWDLHVEKGPVVSLQHDGPVRIAEYSPDGTLFMAVSSDEVWLRDRSGSHRETLHHDGTVISAQFSPADLPLRVLTTALDGMVRLWDPDGTLVWSRQLGEPAPPSVESSSGPLCAFSPRGEIVTVTNRSAQLWSFEGTKGPLLKGHEEQIHGAVFSPDGNLVLTWSRDATVRLWSREGLLLHEFHAESVVRTARFSNRGELVIVTTSGQLGYVIDIDASLIATLRGHRIDLLGGIFSPDDQRILTWSHDGTARIWELASAGRPILWGPRMDRNGALVDVSPSGMLTRHRGEVRLWDRRGVLVRRFPTPSDPSSVMLSPVEECFVTGHVDAVVQLWDFQGNPLRRLLGARGFARSARFSPDGRRIVAAVGLASSPKGEALVWDTEGRHPPVRLIGHQDWIKCADFGSGCIVTGSADNTARRWDLNGEQLQVYEGHQAGVNWVSLSESGEFLLTASGDTTARLWNVETGQTLQSFEGHDGAVWCAVFSPAEDKILTASRDGTARLWDRHGEQLLTLRGHRGTVWNALFTPDGKYVVTAASDGTVRSWFADSGDLIGHALDRLSGRATTD